jgi:hypothetical protein
MLCIHILMSCQQASGETHNITIVKKKVSGNVTDFKHM